MITLMIHVLPKKDILDPQGKTIHQALHNLGYSMVEEVRMGKQIRLSLDTDNEQEALEMGKKMCDDLLVNPQIESYSMDILTS
jgi:phosphoribosylformylglycinamidine synthase subunit PurS